MRTERALKFRLNQLNNILEHRQGKSKDIVKAEIKLMEWVLKMDRRSLYLKKLAIKKKHKK